MICHGPVALRNSRMPLEAFNCFSNIFFPFVMLRRCHHQPCWTTPSLTTWAMPMTFALLLMLRSLQEELRPYHHNLQCMWEHVFHLSLHKRIPASPFWIFIPIRNKCPCFPLSRDTMTLEMIPQGLLFAADTLHFVRQLLLVESPI